MAKVIQFPTDYPPHQWPLRQQMLRLLEACGINGEEFNERYMREGSGRTWGNLSDALLLQIIQGLQKKRALQYHERHIKKAAAQYKTAPASPARRAVIIPFPMTPEALARMEARQKAAPAARPKKVIAAKAEIHAKQMAANPDGKTRLIRKIKMVQRDCEKMLPEFSDYTYRAILQEGFNAASSKELDNLQLINLLLYLKGLLTSNQGGGKPTVDAPALLFSDASGLSRCGSMRKIQALLAEKGKAEGKKYVRWSYALAILKNQTKGVVADWENATPRQLDAVIAALSRDAQRKGRRTL